MENSRLDQNDKFIQLSGKHITYCLRTLKQVVFEVTEVCNLRCRYCAYSDFYTLNGDRSEKDMDYDTARTVLDYLFELWSDKTLKTIPLRTDIAFYGGEPLLNTALIEKIINYINQHKNKVNRAFTYSMTSNCLLLTKKIDFLAKNGIRVLVSLDGDEKGDSLRVDAAGNPTFRRVYAQLKYIQKEYPDYFNKYISFNSVLNAENDYASIANFIFSEFGKMPHVSQLRLSDLNENSIEGFSRICNKDPYNECDGTPLEVSPSFAAFMHDYRKKSGNCFYDYNELLYNPEDARTIPTGTCIPFSKKMFISARGKIVQCERVDQRYALGAVDGNKMQLDCEKIAAIHNERVSGHLRQCSKCVSSHKCPICVLTTKTKESCSSFSTHKDASIRFGGNNLDPSSALEMVYNTKVTR